MFFRATCVRTIYTREHKSTKETVIFTRHEVFAHDEEHQMCPYKQNGMYVQRFRILMWNYRFLIYVLFFWHNDTFKSRLLLWVLKWLNVPFNLDLICRVGSQGLLAWYISLCFDCCNGEGGTLINFSTVIDLFLCN